MFAAISLDNLNAPVQFIKKEDEMSCSAFPRGYLLTLTTALVVGTSTFVSAQSADKFFTYPVQKETLPNGLDVIIIEMPEFKDVLSYNTLVLAGARNETERGKTGLAHLFEHILFRHKYKGQVNGYDETMDELGAFNNAWTWFDVTYYHPLTFAFNLDSKPVTKGTESLPGILELESGRFVSLAFDEKIFKTETGAVLGEYRRVASNPGLKMSEKMLELAYPLHSYGHTTIGYYEDVLDMPNHYDAAVRFYQTYYRPNNCALIISGDVNSDELLPKIRKYYGNWKTSTTPDVTVEDPPQDEERRGHVPWESDVPPRVSVAYKTPEYKTESVETAVGQVLPELLVSQSAPLFRKLRYEKKTASAFYFEGGKSTYEGFDPRLVIATARLYKQQYSEKGKQYLEEVIQDITAGFHDLKNFSALPDASDILETVKSKYRYDLLASFDSPASVSETFVWYYRFERDANVLDNLVASVEKLQPSDIDTFAKKFFVSNNRVIVTMSHDINE